MDRLKVFDPSNGELVGECGGVQVARSGRELVVTGRGAYEFRKLVVRGARERERAAGDWIFTLDVDGDVHWTCSLINSDTARVRVSFLIVGALPDYE